MRTWASFWASALVRAPTLGTVGGGASSTCWDGRYEARTEPRRRSAAAARFPGRGTRGWIPLARGEDWGRGCLRRDRPTAHVLVTSRPSFTLSRTSSLGALLRSLTGTT